MKFSEYLKPNPGEFTYVGASSPVNIIGPWSCVSPVHSIWRPKKSKKSFYSWYGVGIILSVVMGLLYKFDMRLALFRRICIFLYGDKYVWYGVSVLFKLLRYGVNSCDMGSVSFKLLQYGVNSCVTNRNQYIYNRLKTLLTLLEFDSWKIPKLISLMYNYLIR